MKFREARIDLFDMPDDYVLTHCISADAKMGAGIALQFKKRFPHMQDVLFYKNPQIGQAIAHIENDRLIYNLITKQKYWQKPTYETLEQSLISLREQIVHGCNEQLAMPMIGSGLDKLAWSKNRQIIQDVFAETDVEIVTCYL